MAITGWPARLIMLVMLFFFFFSYSKDICKSLLDVNELIQTHKVLLVPDL